jgi:hypothetical protein
MSYSFGQNNKKYFSFKHFMEYIDGDLPPAKPIPALVAQAQKNNPEAKKEKKIEVEFEKNYINIKGEIALVGKIKISSNVDIDSVYEEIKQEAKSRVVKITKRDDLGKITRLDIIDTKNNNFIKNAYFENISDCKIKMFDEIEILSTLKLDALVNKKLEINKKLMDIISNFEKIKNKEGIIEIKFNFILPAFRL